MTDSYKNILLAKHLSFGAKGLYIYLRENFPNGNFKILDLPKFSNNGRTEVSKYAKELINVKLIESEQIRKDGKVIGIKYNYNNLTPIETDLHRVGYIYLIRAKNYYKLGSTTSPKQRFNSIKRKFGELYPIKYVKVNNYLQKESFLLGKFSDKRIEGEWFSLSNIDIEDICNTMTIWEDEYKNKIKI